MGKQHNSFKKDIDLLSEAYGSMMGGAHMSMGGLAQQAAGHMREEDDEHDKTGHMSDEALLDAVDKKGTAGDALLRAARERIRQGESLTPHERDALARDEYGYHGEDNEDTDEADAGPEARRRDTEDETASRQGFSGSPATPAH
jgi:hypothetical protein